MWTIFSLAFAAEHANHFEDVDPSGDPAAIGVTDAWARDAEAKIKVHVENRTKDFLIVDLDKASAHFGEQELEPSDDKVKVFGPGDKGSRVLDFAGTGLHVEKATLHMKGMSRVTADSPVEKLPDFRLPVAKKSFETDNVDCSVAGKAKLTTDMMQVKLKCQFTGEGLALIDESKIQIKFEDGKPWGNESGGKPEAVLPLDNFTLKVKLTVEKRTTGYDMQFAEMNLQFNDAVRVGTPKPIDDVDVQLAFSAEKTEAANK